MATSTPPVSALTQSIAADLAEEFEQMHRFSIERAILGNGRPDALFAVVPKGKQLVSIKPFADAYLKLPERRTGTATIRDQESLIAHVRRFSSEESAIFANPDPKQPSFTAVYDYHPRSADATDADWLQHRAVFGCQLSDEWKAWIGKNGQVFSQADFAAFLEDRITDAVVVRDDDAKLKEYAELVNGAFADPSKLIELSRGLTVNVGVAVRDAVTLSTGEISITHVESHTDGKGQPIRVPNLFAIQIPVFYGGDPYRIPVRLRYRVNQGVQWSYQMVRPDRVFDHAFNEIVTTVQHATELPVFLGSPEA